MTEQTPDHVVSRRKVRRIYSAISFALLCSLGIYVALTAAFVPGAADGLAKVAGTLTWIGAFLVSVVLGYLGLGHRENMAAGK